MLPIDELIKKAGNRYTLTTIVATRSKQLNQGAKPLIELQDPKKPLFIALEEIMQDKHDWMDDTQ